MLRVIFLTGLCLWRAFSVQSAPIERVWLSHQSHDPSRVVLNWETIQPAPSKVRFGLASAYEQEVTSAELVTRHHVEIPVPQKDAVYHYSVGEGEFATPDATFKSVPTKELRVAIVGDWGYAKATDYSALIKEDAHLLLTAGDNVANLHKKGKEGTRAFSALIDRVPELFRSVTFMPILGNHDREITPRGPGPKPPAHAVYDVSATAYREFFALPGEEWKWHFDVPGFDLRFIALDLNHISDFGTNWQTCHAFDEHSEQYRWYRDLMAQTRAGYVVTLMNEKQTAVEGRTQGIWHREFVKGSALVTGFGYFAERAELKGGLPYFNTCLKGDGTPYKDPNSKFFASQDSYLLLTFRQDSAEMIVQTKNLQGEVLDSYRIPKRR